MENQNSKTIQKQKKENLSLRNDYFFKRVFAKDGNESILKDFLEAILQISIENVEVKNPEIPKDMLDSKVGILDVNARINNGTMVDIEMQMINQKNIDKRTATYLSKEYGMQLKEGEEYSKAHKVIAVNILNFEYYKRNSYHSIAHMKFENTEESSYVDMGYEAEDNIAIEDFEVHFIELPKFIKKNPTCKRKLEQWLWLLMGEEEKIEMAEKENQEIKKAKREIEVLSQDETERYMYELRQKAIRDEKNIRESGYEDGLKEGIKEIAKRMLEEKIPIDTIIKITGLKEEEIRNL